MRVQVSPQVSYPDGGTGIHNKLKPCLLRVQILVRIPSPHSRTGICNGFKLRGLWVQLPLRVFYMALWTNGKVDALSRHRCWVRFPPELL